MTEEGCVIKYLVNAVKVTYPSFVCFAATFPLNIGGRQGKEKGKWHAVPIEVDN